MGNFKMYPGSKEKNTPGGTSAKQTGTAKKLFRHTIESTRSHTERKAEKFIKKAVKKGASNFKKNTKKIGNVAKKVMEYQVAPYKAVIKKAKQIKAKHQAKKAIKGSAVEGATEALQSKAQSYGKKKESMVIGKSMRATAKKIRKKVKPVASTIKPKGIAKTQMTKTTMPVSKIAMKTITKGPKPKLKPTPKIKKVKNKETKRKKTQKVKYYKN